MEYSLRIEEIDEEDKFKKCTPIKILVKLIGKLSATWDCLNIRGRLRYILPMGIQDNRRNQMVVKNYKNQQTSPYLHQSDISCSDNNGCIPNSMGSNFSSSKTKNKDKPKKGNTETITRRKRSSNSIRKRQVILSDRFKEYEVELYGSNRIKTKSKTPERLSNNSTEMVKLCEEINIESKRDYSHLLSIFSLPSINKEIKIQKNPDKNRQYSSNVQHQQEIRSNKYHGRYGNYQKETH
jgi:hypothetical protein